MKQAITIKRGKTSLRVILSVLACAACATAAATQITYYPINPSFGGNPQNGAVLLNNAQAQNKHTDDPNAPSPFDMQGASTPLQDFNDSLQRSILSRIASSATTQIIGPNGELRPGNVETTDFRISVVNAGGGLLQITTTDKSTGAQTSFQVGNQ